MTPFEELIEFARCGLPDAAAALEKLRAWIEPYVGPVTDCQLLELCRIVESAAAESGTAPEIQAGYMQERRR